MVSYGVTVQYSPPVTCVALSEDAQGTPVDVQPPDEIGGCLAISLSPEESRSTRVDIRWECNGPDPGEMSAEELEAFEFYRERGILYLPTARIDPPRLKAIDGQYLRWAVNDYLLLMSLQSGHPNFYLQVSRCRLDRNDAKMEARVGGLTFELLEHSIFMEGLSSEGRGVLPVGTPPFDRARLAQIAGLRCAGYHGLLFTADRRFSEYATPDAVVHLAQALEVAVYRVVRGTRSIPENWQFHPNKVFSSQPDVALNPPIPFDAAAFVAICELWGARHEWVHNGRARVRQVYLSQGRATIDRDETKAVDLVAADYIKFRSAVFKALAWMGEPSFQ